MPADAAHPHSNPVQYFPMPTNDKYAPSSAEKMLLQADQDRVVAQVLLRGAVDTADPVPQLRPCLRVLKNANALSYLKAMFGVCQIPISSVYARQLSGVTRPGREQLLVVPDR
jgi:hypothetical protein